VLLASFAVWELRTRYPMLDVRLFGNRRFSGASAAISLTFFSLFGTIFFLTTYLQQVLGYTPFDAGIRVIPVALGIIVASGLSARLTARVGTKVMVAGGLATVASALFLLSTATADTGYGLVGAVLLTMGVGMGLAMAPATDSVMGSLPLAKASVGSAMSTAAIVAAAVVLAGSLAALLLLPSREAEVVELPAGENAPVALAA
jgi:predicted MFS family arabinose efflux permease